MGRFRDIEKATTITHFYAKALQLHMYPSAEELAH